MTLVLQRCNVDRCFWTIGPGGVGQSLLTHHIHAVFQGLHAFLDTNVFYTDDELRKQGEQLVNKLILTAQEAVQGSSAKMREDLYKKVVSADPCAVRMPYAIITRLVEFSGWTRFELNSLVKFLGVTEASFESILRRSWVCALKGRFVSADVVARTPDASAKGVFEKDPHLKAFLKSGPAQLVTIKLVHGYARKHD